MSSNRLTSRHLRELLQSPWVNQLEQIHLGFNQLGDEGAAALGAIPWDRLRVLALGQNGIDAPGVRALTGGALTTLASLSLELNRIGPRGARHLAESANLSNLEELDLAAARVESDGASALARSSTLTSLKRLNLRGNQITSAAARDLAASQWELTYLDLRSNSFENVPELRERYGEALVI
jgi:Ran GTPase-activating protein (RanGAP) involved in mRNA processing and transport